MFEIRPVSPTTQRQDYAHQEAQEQEKRAGALDLIIAYILNTLGKWLG